MSDIAVKVEDLWKRYAIGHKKSSSFRESIGQWFTKSEADYFWALKELNFEIKRGEAVGIIGKNGAGKSTLLKVLSKITYPTKGRIEINGRVSSLLEVGTGFHPELSGRQNVYLNGTILGMTRREITAKFDEIVAFSGVEKFIDTPVKHYSSGMKVRLAFSVAAHLEPEILIIDEVLAVGDAEFQKKCLGKMEDVTGEGRTVLFVSHNMGAVEDLCESSILLKNGSVQAKGLSRSIIDNHIFNSDKIKSNSYTSSCFRLKIEAIKIRNCDDEITNEFTELREVSISFSFKVQENIHQVKTGLAIILNNGLRLFTEQIPDDIDLKNHKKGDVFIQTFNFSILNLTPGRYQIVFGVRDEFDNTIIYNDSDLFLMIKQTTQKQYSHQIFNEVGFWSVKKNDNENI
jgi:ABC-type polysaccharide/polyol phosphate transport system ATPase subunit